MLLGKKCAHCLKSVYPETGTRYCKRYCSDACKVEARKKRSNNFSWKKCRDNLKNIKTDNNDPRLAKGKNFVRFTRKTHDEKIIKTCEELNFNSVDCKYIPVSNDQMAIVDSLVYDHLMQWRWLLSIRRQYSYVYRLIYSAQDEHRSYMKQKNLSREVWELHNGKLSVNKHIKYRNKNSLDNRLCNLC